MIESDDKTVLQCKLKSEKKKRTTKIVFYALSVLNLMICGLIWLLPTIHEHQCRARNLGPFDAVLTDSIWQAQVVIIRETTTKSENDTSTSRNTGASGVVINQSEEGFLILTAAHVVADRDNSVFLIAPYGSPSMAEWRASLVTWNGYGEYYSHFPQAEIIGEDLSLDLALLRFTPAEIVPAIMPLGDESPAKGNELCVIGCQGSSWFKAAAGEVGSNDIILFYAPIKSNKDIPPTPVLKHNAYVEPGSSGAAVLNTEGQLIGINIGGVTDFLNRFRYGVFVPIEKIKEFIDPLI